MAAIYRKLTLRDPLDAGAWRLLGSALLRMLQFDEAQAALNRSLEINPVQTTAPGLLGMAYLLEDKPAAALESYERSSSDTFRRFGRALIYPALGRSEEAVEALAQLISKDGETAAFQIAAVYAVRGDKDQAFAWLERARAQHDGGITVLKSEPILRSLHGDPRWTALLEKLHLPLD